VELDQWSAQRHVLGNVLSGRVAGHKKVFAKGVGFSLKEHGHNESPFAEAFITPAFNCLQAL
jgi:hypothetical protein